MCVFVSACMCACMCVHVCVHVCVHACVHTHARHACVFMPVVNGDRVSYACTHVLTKDILFDCSSGEEGGQAEISQASGKYSERTDCKTDLRRAVKLC